MKKFSILLAMCFASTGIMAQTAGSTDDLLKSLNTDSTKQPVISFRSTRLILSETPETIKKKTLNFMVIHRFGDFSGDNGGGQIFYGLDAVADVYIGFEYGITDKLNVDLGRSTIGRLVNVDLKYSLLQQTTDNSMPVSLSLFGQSAVHTYGVYSSFGDRLAYFGEAILSRQFSRFSVQVAPGFVQDNIPNPNVAGNENNFFSLSAAARLKVSKHMALVVDYAHPFSSFRQNSNIGFSDPFGFGLEVETGGHVFTINITNSRAVEEVNYLSSTLSKYSEGQYRIGFTISRIFDFNHKSTYK
ncbi:hypothetical protein KXQ82_16830 [Mucilaginibacter sp. HMF5004]|uniref:DUF5777 family beta-barrel protein n=1 Tax=Mucilaginibacter rivuli TaxID=2857527 RepID=UPI001C5E1A86|nr:DUF5777 family beta-barrel protein [Mucilaginibacter rivuli]MBW4891396.1 hypothetical protein [Mucilaginibacter rivuli]